MKVSESVYSVNIPFSLPAGGGRSIERSVRAFLVAGKEACLVDAGVAGSSPALLAMVGEAGKSPGKVSTLVLTHSHPDHIGGGPGFQRATGCMVAAHPAERAWIENPDLQAGERPVPGFTTIVEGPLRVDRLLGEGDRIGIGGDRYLTVLHTPGHSAGSISLFLEDEGVLITGDAIPVKGEIPVYDDPVASLASIRKLEDLRGVRVLLSSWDSPKTGPAVRRTLAEGSAILRTIHEAVARAAEHETDPARITQRVVDDLGLPEAALPIISRTLAGHIRAVEQGENMGGRD
jgi:hydroxyacylglutathione hydrolase